MADLDESISELEVEYLPCVVCGEGECASKTCSRECCKEYMENPNKYL